MRDAPQKASPDASPRAPELDVAGLARRVEEASLNAWPAMHQLLYDGWLLRFSGGFTKRSNSVVPLYPESLPIEEKVRFCENLYARERLQTIFRLTSLASVDGNSPQPAGSIDAYLAGRGYTHADETLVLSCELSSDSGATLDDAQFRLRSPSEWLDAYAGLTNMPAHGQQLHAAILGAIRTDCAFATLSDGATTLACGLGVVEEGLLGLFDVVTAREHRQRGLGTRLVRGLMDWGVAEGAQRAYLQMVADNTPASGLYAKLGFSHLYHYWYRMSP